MLCSTLRGLLATNMHKGTAAKDRLWSEQAMQMNRTPNELKTWYESMQTKLGKLKKAITKSGQAADRFTATEQLVNRSILCYGVALVGAV